MVEIRHPPVLVVVVFPPTDQSTSDSSRNTSAR
jgi:hypothetical protein